MEPKTNNTHLCSKCGIKDTTNFDKIRKELNIAYDALGDAINATDAVSNLFASEKDKRFKVCDRATNLIMKVQEILNPLAQDEDIGLI